MKTISSLGAVKYILDPIHGSVPITQLELEIISTPIFQRLRHISQLSLASLVFPGATHARFQHCIGTMHIMDRLLNSLDLSDKFGIQSDERNTIIQTMRVAGLLHDIGHLPFSHSFEKVNVNLDHEKIGEIIINRSDISEILTRNGIDSNSIGNLITGHMPTMDPHFAELNVLQPLMESQIDADRMDYLLRDSYFTGVPYGNIDLERICNFVTIHDNKICFDEKAQNAIEDFLYGRYQMYKTVYSHKTNIGYDLVLNKLIKEYLPEMTQSPTPFIIPDFHTLVQADADWFNHEFCSLNEDSFTQNYYYMVSQGNFSDPTRKDAFINLFQTISYRKPIPLAYSYDTFTESRKITTQDISSEENVVKNEEYCEKERELFDELKSYGGIVEHWSFMRHDPSKPLPIMEPISKSTGDEQDAKSIRILTKTGTIEDLLQRSNSILQNLATHHLILLGYYHQNSQSQEIIRNLARKKFQNL